MMIAISLAVCVVFVLLATLTRRSLPSLGAKACVSDIPGIYSRMKAEGKEGSFVVFIFAPGGRRASGDALNIQLSVEGGRVGLDWVLVSPANVADREKFERAAGTLGFQVSEREANGVKYLRVEAGDDLPRLCEKILLEHYSVPQETKLDLVVEGISWP